MDPTTDLRSALLYALKPASWSKLAVPGLLGTAVGVASAGRIDLSAAAFGWAYTALLLVGIVLLNDWADVDVDALKRRMFPEAGSPKTIPDGILSRQTVFRLGAGGLLGAFGTCVWLAGWYGRTEILAVGGLGIGLFVAYSLPPVRINAHGGGEVLEALGVGIVLPTYHALLQHEGLALEHLLPFVPYAMLSMASAIASGLADERSDRRGGKVTVVTTWGNRRARRATEAAWIAGTLAYGLLPPLVPELVTPWAAFAAGGTSLFFGRTMLAWSDAATPEAWGPLRRYKGALHRAIWGSGAVLALGIALGAVS